MTTISTDVRRFCFDLDSQEGAPRTADDGRQLLPLRLAPASVNLWKPTWSCTNQKQQKRVCLIYAQDRRKTTRAVNSAETSESERGELQRNTSHRTDGSAQVQIPVAQYQTRFKNNYHNTKKCWTLFFEIYKQQFKQVSDKSGQETRKTVKVVDISSNLLFLFCFTRRSYVFRLRVKWI